MTTRFAACVTVALLSSSGLLVRAVEPDAAGLVPTSSKITEAGDATTKPSPTKEEIENEKIKDRETLATQPITAGEYAEAAMGNTRMHREDGDDRCGHSYCNDLLEYKPMGMQDDQFVNYCIKAHQDWERTLDYSLSCDPQNPVRLKAKLAEELRVRTMKLIDDNRLEREEKKSHQFAADSVASDKANKAARNDVKEGAKQRKAVTILSQKIDVRKHLRDKRDAMKIKVRCKRGEKIDSVYAAVSVGTRSVDCPPEVVQKVDMEADQGYLKVDDVMAVDDASSKQ
jgi:hypothetical protein